MHYDYLIVGAGLYGAVFAHEMTAQGKRCLVIEKRNHIAGNIYTREVEGIAVHQYGAHIFHTSNKQVWDYVNQFAVFNRYTNSPVANYKGEIYNLPFNMNTFNQMWGVITPEQARAKIAEQKEAAGITEPQNLEEQAISLVGTDIYEKLVNGYTQKQWGRPCRELPSFIIKRLPVRLTYDNNYFNDLYQGIPVEGYTAMVEKLLEGIEVRLNTDYLEDKAYWDGQADKIIYTGPIDAYFGYRLGALAYRCVRFETEVLDTDNYQGNAVVNYTDAETPYTRIIEHKHFVFGTQPKTVISKEYSTEWKPGDEPYYPINDEKNSALYAKYKALADGEEKVIFGGRLGEYKYYDMDKVIELALKQSAEQMAMGSGFDLASFQQFDTGNEHHIYHEWYLNERTGGPPGYLANLLLGYNQLTELSMDPLITFDAFHGKAPAKEKPHISAVKRCVKAVFQALPGGGQFYKRYISRYNKRFYLDQKRFLSNLDEIFPDSRLVSKMNWSKIRSIHVHTVAEAVKMRNYLSRNFYDNIKLILTCHTPESVSKEQYGVYIEGGLDKARAAELAERWGEIERRAFRYADIIVFPSPEAMEPMLRDVPGFRDLIHGKDIRFMATGAKRLHSNLTKEEAKKKYGVSGKKVVGFIGRHNLVKGYDLLQEAAQEVLRQRDDVVFLIGGTPSAEIKPLKNPAWIEIGWVQPADFFQALDVFVLPNRQTYYDLVLLEVMSTGTPVIATATGGNKSVQQIAADMILCDVNAASMSNAILNFLSQDSATREMVGANLKSTYEAYFTEKEMASRYVNLVHQIYDDYDLWAETGEGEVRT